MHEKFLFRKSLIRHLPQQVSFLFRFSRKGSSKKTLEKFYRKQKRIYANKNFFNRISAHHKNGISETGQSKIIYTYQKWQKRKSPYSLSKILGYLR